MFSRILQTFGLQRIPETKPEAAKPKRRYFDAAQVSRLTMDWATSITSADRELLSDLAKLRGRTRELARNNDYMQRFLSMVTANVIGPAGIVLQSKASVKTAAQAVEDAWADWGRLGNCTVEGRQTWQDFQRLAIQTVALDGEVLIRLVRRGVYGLQLQILDVDQLGAGMDTISETKSGNQIRMGVEIDSYGKPVAYHVASKHPAEGYTKTERIPASEIIHEFILQRPGQNRGWPWASSAAKSINMMDGYMEAELVAARTGAAKMGFFTSEMGDAYTGDSLDSDGAPQIDAEPGKFEALPAGYKFEAWDPQHPTAAFKDFQKAILRSISSGLGVSYNSLANDLEGVNFSSIRSGVLEEREQWRMIQRWTIDHVLQPIFDAWWDSALLSGKLRLPGPNMDRYRPVRWVPRGWAWVDPLKDVQASREALDLGLTTRADILSAQGKDLEEIFEQLAKEKDLADSYGLEFGEVEPEPEPAQPMAAEEPEEEDVETED